MPQKIAVIVGAGPAGLTAAHELLARSDILPIIIEATGDLGGISKTVVYKGNRLDLGGHRFFSKSDAVMAWWRDVLPVQERPARDDIELGRQVPLAVTGKGADPEKTDKVFLWRSRLSRIFFLRSFFDYPVTLKWQTFRNLGLARLIKTAWSYARIRLRPIRDEKSLEDFFINRFGHELYATFFRDYTEKVWGVACRDIPADWGAQRVKGLSVSGAIIHAVRHLLARDKSIEQKETETSLIEQFLYPKLGPGQLWEEVGRRIIEDGGQIHLEQRLTAIQFKDGRITAVTAVGQDGEERHITCDYLISSMPVKDLVAAMPAEFPPPEIAAIAANLIYRDFMTVGLLLNRLLLKNDTKLPTVNDLVPDNWIYIQERDVRLGRLQIFNNWSPYMVADRRKVWMGLEYFCNEGDDLWSMADADFIRFATGELAKIGIIDAADVLDATVLRVPKAYPAYFGGYRDFPKLRSWLDGIDNLFLIGRNGMHRYNNMDHSMLTAIAAVENIIGGIAGKENIWRINSEEEYHEGQ